MRALACIGVQRSAFACTRVHWSAFACIPKRHEKTLEFTPEMHAKPIKCTQNHLNARNSIKMNANTRQCTPNYKSRVHWRALQKAACIGVHWKALACIGVQRSAFKKIEIERGFRPSPYITKFPAVGSWQQRKALISGTKGGGGLRIEVC